MISNLSDMEYPLGELESSYRKHYLRQDIRQTITVGVFWLLPNFLFMYVDYLLYADQALFHTLLMIRLFLLVALSLVFLSFLRVKNPAAYDYLALLGSCVVLIGIFCANRSHPDIHTHTAGLDYLILFSLYMLVPNRVLFRSLPCAVFSVANFIAYCTQPTPPSAPILTIIAVSLIMSNVLGAWASSRFYSHRRRQYEAQARAQELRKDLIQNALVDQLTGVANRRHFFQNAALEFDRFIRYQRPFSVLMLDLDHFKNVNDQFGHPVGDKVLRDLAHTINQCKRDIDTFGRIGGEEFALLLPETGLSSATEVAVRLRRACYSVIVPGTNSQRITVSIGVTQARPDDENFDEVLARADETLYRAKNNGRDRVEVA